MDPETSPVEERSKTISNVHPEGPRGISMAAPEGISVSIGSKAHVIDAKARGIRVIRVDSELKANSLTFELFQIENLPRI